MLFLTYKTLLVDNGSTAEVWEVGRFRWWSAAEAGARGHAAAAAA